MAKLRKMLGSADSAECTALMRQIETQSKETLVRWAAGYAQDLLLPILQTRFTGPEPAAAVNGAKQWLAGEISPKDVKPLLKSARDCVKAVSDPVSEAAVRGVSTACAVITTPTNALGFVFYAAAAIAYDRVGLEETAAVYDSIAAEVFTHALETLRAVSVENEPNPAKIDWSC